MEKQRPHFSLASIKAEFSDKARLNMTNSALVGMSALGLGLDDVVAVIQSIDGRGTSLSGHFYKSMTAAENSARWQDVYHVPYQRLVVYVKFTTDHQGHLLISFKEK